MKNLVNIRYYIEILQVLESSLFIERARMEHGGRCCWIFFINEIEIEIDGDNLILRILGFMDSFC